MIEEKGETFPAFETDPGHPGVALRARAHGEVHGDPPPTRMSPSVRDAGWLADRGLPVVVYGPGRWEQAHAVDEAVATEDLLACARVSARVISEWCER